MNRLFNVFIFILALSCIPSVNALILFNDSFDRGDSTTVGNGWTESGAGSYAQILNNKLRLTKTGSSEYVQHAFMNNISGSNEIYIVSYDMTASWSGSVGNGDMYQELFTDDARGSQIAAHKLHNDGGPSCSTGFMLSYEIGSPYGACITTGFSTSPVSMHIDSFYNKTSSKTTIVNISVNGGAKSTYTLNAAMSNTDLNNNVTLSFAMNSAAATSAIYDIDNLTVSSVVIGNPEAVTLSVTATNALNGSSINTYSVNVTQIGNTTTSFLNTTTTGIASFNIPSNRTYNVSIIAQNYTTDARTISLNYSDYSHNFVLYATRYINISFINDTTGKQPLTGVNVTTSFISEQSSFQKSNSSGYQYVELMIPETYFIRSSATGYENSYYYVTITQNSTENITLYMYPSAQYSTITASVIDSTAKDAEGVYIKVLKYDVSTNSYVLREIVKTDSQGDATFSAELNNEFYKFILERPFGSVIFESTPGAITSTSVNFVIPSGTVDSDFFNTIFDAQCGISFNNDTNNFRFTYSDGTNSVSQGCLEADRIYTNRSTLFNSTCLNSNTGSLLVGIDPVNGSYYRATGYIIIGGDRYFCGSAIADFSQDGTIGQMGIFIVFLLTIVIVFILRSNPIASVFSIPIPATFAKIAGIIIIPTWSIVALWALSIIIIVMLSKRV